MNKYKLCYVDGNWAYFTIQELNDQWGDDWDDYPYQHNAGEPYELKDSMPSGIIKLAFISKHCQPCDDLKEAYCVKDINEKLVPWLSKPVWWKETYGKLVEIYAGEPYESFISKLKDSGGEVYIKG